MNLFELILSKLGYVKTEKLPSGSTQKNQTTPSVKPSHKEFVQKPSLEDMTPNQLQHKFFTEKGLGDFSSQPICFDSFLKQIPFVCQIHDSKSYESASIHVMDSPSMLPHAFPSLRLDYADGSSYELKFSQSKKTYTVEVSRTVLPTDNQKHGISIVESRTYDKETGIETSRKLSYDGKYTELIRDENCLGRVFINNNGQYDFGYHDQIDLTNKSAFDRHDIATLNGILNGTVFDKTVHSDIIHTQFHVLPETYYKSIDISKSALSNKIDASHYSKSCEAYANKPRTFDQNIK